MDQKLVMGLIIIFLMISSVFGIVFMGFGGEETAGSVRYNSIKFTDIGGRYRANVGGTDHIFLFFPGDLEYMQIDDAVRSLLDQPVYTVTYDPNANMAENLGEMQYYLEIQLQDSKAIERALTESADADLPVKSCEDATNAQPVIELRESEESGIVAEGNCVIIKAVDPYDLYQETERLAYHILGVIE